MPLYIVARVSRAGVRWWREAGQNQNRADFWSDDADLLQPASDYFVGYSALFLVFLSLNSKSGKTEKRGNASYVNKEIQQKRTKNQERLTRIIPLQGKKSGKSGNKLLLNTGSMPVDTISRARKFQPRVSPWVERLGDTTSRTLSLMPRGAVAVACWASPTIPSLSRRTEPALLRASHLKWRISRAIGRY